MQRLLFISLLGFLSLISVAQNQVLPPDRIYGQLFLDVQMQRVFPDSKTFADCSPLKNPAGIISDYLLKKRDSLTVFSLQQFVKENFALPEATPSGYQSDGSDSVSLHIRKLWKVLKRDPDPVTEGNSLLPLPFPI